MSISMAVRRSTTRTLERMTPKPDPGRRRAPRGTVMNIPRFGITGFMHPAQGNDVNKLVSTLVESEGGNMTRLMALYDDMRERDARLDAVCRTRVLALTGKDWSLQPPIGLERDPEALKMVERLTKVLSLLPDLTTLIAQLMDGALRGYSVVEMEWGMRDELHLPQEFAWRDPGRFAFGDRMRIHRSDAEDGFPGVLLEDYGPDRFIVHSPAGGRACYVTRRGALRPCMWPSMTKRYGLRWWLVAAERFGQPAPVLKVPDGDDNLFDDACDMLRGLSEDWQAVITEGMELELVPGSGQFTGELHKSMVDLANTEMSICILGQNLSTEVQGGSFAAAKVHDSVRLDYLAADAAELGETLRRELLEPIVRYNWPDSPVPRWEFTLVQPESAEVQEWHITQGIVSVNEARESLGFSAEADDGAASELRPAPQALPGEKPQEAPLEMPMPEVVETEAWLPANMVVLADEQPWHILGTPEEAVTNATAELNPWGKWVLGELTSRLTKAGQGEWRQRMALQEWSMTLDEGNGPDFERVIFEILMRGDMAGRLGVSGIELGSDKLIDLSDVVTLAVGDWVERFFGSVFDAAVEFFLRKQVVHPWEFDAMQDRWREGAFIARRLANDRLVERARQILAAGMDQQQTIAQINSRLERELGLGETNRDQWYAETITRTNLASAYGAGRHAQMSHPEVRALRPFVQYRTIGDSRVRGADTSPATKHAALADRVFVNGSRMADQYAPPLGFNCRCQMVTLSQRQFERRDLHDKLTRDIVVINGVPYIGDKGWTQPARRSQE